MTSSACVELQSGGHLLGPCAGRDGQEAAELAELLAHPLHDLALVVRELLGAARLELLAEDNPRREAQRDAAHCDLQVDGCVVRDRADLVSDDGVHAAEALLKCLLPERGATAAACPRPSDRKRFADCDPDRHAARAVASTTRRR
jgi:hypothetical protein